MQKRKIKNKSKTKFLLFSIIICFGLLFSIYVGSVPFTNSQPSIRHVNEGNNTPINTDVIIPGNLTRKWEPIVLNLSNLPSAFKGMSWGNIRVTIYNPNDARWHSIPFQIDEWGGRFEWQDGTYLNKSAITIGATFGITGLDTDGIDDQPSGSSDELVFYAHSGAYVPPTMWWEGDSGGTYPNRLEVMISDPVDGGHSWMYIYYDKIINHGNPVPTWSDYPKQGWNSTEFRAFGEHYNVVKNKTNPDLENKLYSNIGQYDDLFNESFKSYSDMTLTNATLAYTENITANREGIWNSTSYSDRKTELAYPENTSSGGFENEGGAGTVIVSGPIRTIVNKRIFMVFNNSIHPLYSVQHQNEIFYMDSKIVKYVKQIDSYGLFNISINYDYDFVTSINKSIRSNIKVYEGWRNATIKVNTPNGVANESGELKSTLGPTGTNPKAPVKLNPDIPDFIFFTSSSSGSAWMLCPRDQYNISNSGVYWKDDNSTSEIGLIISDIYPDAPLVTFIKWKYTGSISNPLQAKKEGLVYLRQTANPLTLNGTVQSRPIDTAPPLIGQPLQIPSPSVNNDSTTVIVNITDFGVGVHRVFLVYSNGSIPTTIEMYYLPEYGLYSAEIPKHPYLTNISYFIYANDTFGNYAYTPFDYLGEFSFTTDIDNLPPSHWYVPPVLNTLVNVKYEYAFHRKVVQFYDNNSIVGGWARMNSGFFGHIITGQSEWWMSGIEGTSGNGKFYVEFFDAVNTTAIKLKANWDTGVNTLSYWNGISWSVIVPSPLFKNNTWHHIYITFNCSNTNQTFGIYVDGNYYGRYNLLNSITSISRASFYTGDVDSFNNYMAWVDAIDASWGHKYYKFRDKDTYQMIRQYHGLFSFETDPKGSDPQNWTIYEGGIGTTHVNVEYEKLRHRKVVEFWDDEVSDNCRMINNFYGVQNGTVEWWMIGNDENSSNGAFYIEFADNMFNIPIYLLADWSYGKESLSYFNGTKFVTIVNSPLFTANKWHHIAVKFDAINNSFEIAVDKVYLGKYNFSISVNNITQLIFETGIGNAYNNFYAYVDAVDYSWSNGYFFNRNYVYTTLFNFTVFDPYPPPQVKGVTPLNLGTGNTLNVSWTPSPADDVEYYLVYISSNITGPFTLQANVSAPTTYTIVTNLTDGQTYYFMVSAVDAVPHYGKNSTKKAGIPSDITPPAQVQGVSISVINTGNELNITWSPNTEPDFVHYLVYRSTVSGFNPSKSNWIANTTNTYYHDTELVDGVTYYYKITAIDDGGPTPNEGPPSSQVSGIPQDTVPPGQVTGLQVIVVPSGNKLNLEWNAVSDPDVAGYHIYRNSTSSTFQLIGTTSNTWFNDTSLTDGQKYWYKVAAIRLI